MQEKKKWGWTLFGVWVAIGLGTLFFGGDGNVVQGYVLGSAVTFGICEAWATRMHR